MKRFHWGRDIGCVPSPPYHWSCMFDQLLMWHNAAYSVHYAQRQGSASLWNARAYSRSTYIKMYTSITLLLTWRLQSWHKGDCTESAHHHSLWQTAQCERHPLRGAQAVGASLRDFLRGTIRKNIMSDRFSTKTAITVHISLSLRRDSYLCAHLAISARI